MLSPRDQRRVDPVPRRAYLLVDVDVFSFAAALNSASSMLSEFNPTATLEWIRRSRDEGTEAFKAAVHGAAGAIYNGDEGQLLGALCDVACGARGPEDQAVVLELFGYVASSELVRSLPAATIGSLLHCWLTATARAADPSDHDTPAAKPSVTARKSACRLSLWGLKCLVPSVPAALLVDGLPLSVQCVALGLANPWLSRRIALVALDVLTQLVCAPAPLGPAAAAELWRQTHACPAAAALDASPGSAGPADRPSCLCVIPALLDYAAALDASELEVPAAVDLEEAALVEAVRTGACRVLALLANGPPPPPPLAPCTLHAAATRVADRVADATRAPGPRGAATHPRPPLPGEPTVRSAPLLTWQGHAAVATRAWAGTVALLGPLLFTREGPHAQALLNCLAPALQSQDAGVATAAVAAWRDALLPALARVGQLPRHSRLRVALSVPDRVLAAERHASVRDAAVATLVYVTDALAPGDLAATAGRGDGVEGRAPRDLTQGQEGATSGLAAGPRDRGDEEPKCHVLFASLARGLRRTLRRQWAAWGRCARRCQAGDEAGADGAATGTGSVAQDSACKSQPLLAQAADLQACLGKACRKLVLGLSTPWPGQGAVARGFVAADGEDVVMEGEGDASGRAGSPGVGPGDAKRPSGHTGAAQAQRHPLVQVAEDVASELLSALETVCRDAATDAIAWEPVAAVGRNAALAGGTGPAAPSPDGLQSPSARCIAQGSERTVSAVRDLASLAARLLAAAQVAKGSHDRHEILAAMSRLQDLLSCLAGQWSGAGAVGRAPKHRTGRMRQAPACDAARGAGTPVGLLLAHHATASFLRAASSALPFETAPGAPNKALVDLLTAALGTTDSTRPASPPSAHAGTGQHAGSSPSPAAAALSDQGLAVVSDALQAAASASRAPLALLAALARGLQLPGGLPEAAGGQPGQPQPPEMFGTGAAEEVPVARSGPRARLVFDGASPRRKSGPKVAPGLEMRISLRWGLAAGLLDAAQPALRAMRGELLGLRVPEQAALALPAISILSHVLGLCLCPTTPSSSPDGSPVGSNGIPTGRHVSPSRDSPSSTLGQATRVTQLWADALAVAGPAAALSHLAALSATLAEALHGSLVPGSPGRDAPSWCTAASHDTPIPEPLSIAKCTGALEAGRGGEGCAVGISHYQAGGAHLAACAVQALTAVLAPRMAHTDGSAKGPLPPTGGVVRRRGDPPGRTWHRAVRSDALQQGSSGTRTDHHVRSWSMGPGPSAGGGPDQLSWALGPSPDAVGIVAKRRRGDGTPPRAPLAELQGLHPPSGTPRVAPASPLRKGGGAGIAETPTAPLSSPLRPAGARSRVPLSPYTLASSVLQHHSGRAAPTVSFEAAAKSVVNGGQGASAGGGDTTPTFSRRVGLSITHLLSPAAGGLVSIAETRTQAGVGEAKAASTKTPLPAQTPSSPTAGAGMEMRTPTASPARAGAWTAPHRGIPAFGTPDAGAGMRKGATSHRREAMAAAGAKGDAMAASQACERLSASAAMVLDWVGCLLQGQAVVITGAIGDGNAGDGRPKETTAAEGDADALARVLYGGVEMAAGAVSVLAGLPDTGLWLAHPDGATVLDPTWADRLAILGFTPDASASNASHPSSVDRPCTLGGAVALCLAGAASGVASMSSAAGDAGPSSGRGGRGQSQQAMGGLGRAALGLVASAAAWLEPAEGGGDGDGDGDRWATHDEDARARAWSCIAAASPAIALVARRLARASSEQEVARLCQPLSALAAVAAAVGPGPAGSLLSQDGSDEIRALMTARPDLGLLFLSSLTGQ